MFTTISRVDNLVIFDIDNTLTITKLNVSQQRPVVEIVLNHKLIEELKKYMLKPNTRVLLLTARNYKCYINTYKWASGLSLIRSYKDLYMVEKPIEKLDFLRRSLRKHNHVIYYDDLSYNHEKGNVKLYDHVIEGVSRLGLEYYGIEEIKKLTNGK
jgi:FMN phosphatase YigB (HAD superfamily)